MAMEVSPYVSPLPPSGTHPGQGLEYSRHYAQRIRDLGKTSKESWIKRIWNHMFSSKPNPNNPPSEDDGNHNHTVSFSADTNENGGVLRGRGGHRTDRKSPPNSNLEREKTALNKSDPPNSGGNSNRYHGSNYNKTVTSSGNSLSRSRTLPVELVNSPYLPPHERGNYKLVSVPKPSHRDRERQQTNLSRVNANNGSGSQANHKGESRSAGSNAGKADSTNSSANSNFSKRGDPFPANNPYRQNTQLTPYMRKPTHPYLSQHQDQWKPKITRGVNMINLEKRAKHTADKAMKAGKIFTCEGPYPVDAYVRYFLRKRGWVEKFGQRVMMMATRTYTSAKLECVDDEDFEAICDQEVPPPWEEDYGIHAIMSRIVRHYPAKFIWGGRSVNTMVLRSEVMVNHFPKARYFSSKVGITTSLRELPWIASADPHDFFPRCYLLNEDEKDLLTEDFRLTAAMGLLKLVLRMCTKEEEEASSTANSDTNNKYEEVCHEDADQSEKPASHQLDSCIPEEGSTDKKESNENETSTETANRTVSQEKQTDEFDFQSDQQDSGVDSDMSNIEAGHESSVDEQGDDDLDQPDPDTDVEDDKPPPGGKVRPDLAPKWTKKGGEVPVKAITLAIAACQKFLQFKHHDDIDIKRRTGLISSDWDNLISWYYQVAHEGARIPVTEGRLRECEDMLHRMSKVWPQLEIDGTRNLWIVKPSDKSKGIGIEFCDKLEDITKYIDNATQSGSYVVQKYIERPLLVYNCKFDIRQWFLVTDWSPLTIWFYKDSYLRICSQEYSYDSMHASVHLSNVAVQRFYLNGPRSDKLPDDNFMTSSQFEEYLSEMGAGHAWKEIIYPGMKAACVNTLLATSDIPETRKSAFELYGADFMMSEDFRPWLLEINSSPGMAPGSLPKAKLCAAVVDDTFKVLLDRKETSHCSTGRFELAFRDVHPSQNRCVDNKMLVEGARIRKADLQRYYMLDQKNIKSDKDTEKKEKERERKILEKQEPYVSFGIAVADANSAGQAKTTAKNSDQGEGEKVKDDNGSEAKGQDAKEKKESSKDGKESPSSKDSKDSKESTSKNSKESSSKDSKDSSSKDKNSSQDKGKKSEDKKKS